MEQGVPGRQDLGVSRRYCGAMSRLSYQVRVRASPADANAVARLQQGTPLLAACPGCQTPIQCYVFGAQEEVGAEREIWIHPAPRAHDPLPLDESGELPERLIRDYHAVLDCYASGHWRAATGQARIVLEGLVKHLLSQSRIDVSDSRRRTLGELFAELGKRDLVKPIRDVGDVVREGGNLASHFDADRDITPELAGETLELLDSFINYMILIPERVTRLKTLISGDKASRNSVSSVDSPAILQHGRAPNESGLPS